jgi:tetratricopeptide (TPR) repeat protein
MRKYILSLLILSFCVQSLKAQDVANLIVLGNQAMNEGQYVEAQRYYQAVLAKEPQNWHIMTMYGFSVHKQRRFREADSIYRIVLKNDTVSSKIWWYKGMNHVSMKQDSLAIVHYKKFISLERNRGGNISIAQRTIAQSYERMLYKEGLFSWQIDDMLYYYEQVERAEPSAPEAELIRNFIEKVKLARPGTQTGKWKMEP